MPKKLGKSEEKRSRTEILERFVLVREMGLEPIREKAKSVRGATGFCLIKTIRVQFDG